MNGVYKLISWIMFLQAYNMLAFFRKHSMKVHKDNNGHSLQPVIDLCLVPFMYRYSSNTATIMPSAAYRGNWCDITAVGHLVGAECIVAKIMHLVMSSTSQADQMYPQHGRSRKKSHASTAHNLCNNTLVIISDTSCTAYFLSKTIWIWNDSIAKTATFWFSSVTWFPTCWQQKV